MTLEATWVRAHTVQVTYLVCLYVTVGGAFRECKMPVDSQELAHCLATQTRRDSTLCPPQIELVTSRLLSDVLGLSKEDITHINCKEVYSSLSLALETIVDDL